MNLSTNYAHAAGGCDLALSPDASKIFTCGSDGFICIHESKTYLQKDAGQSVKKIETEEELNCLAVNDDGELIAVGTEENTVKLYSVVSGEFVSNVTRFTLPIRSVEFSPNGVYLAVAGDESIIRVVTVSNVNQSMVLEGHHGAVRCVTYSPDGKTLASTGSDGTLKLWQMSSKMCSSTIRGLPIQRDEMQMCQVAWHPNGSVLAVPQVGKVSMYNPETGEEVYALRGGHKSDVDVMAWSPNGLYMATAGYDLHIIVWDATTREDIGKFKSLSQITRIVWSPNSNSFYTIDTEGQAAVQQNVVPKHLTPPYGDIGRSASAKAQPEAKADAPKAKVADVDPDSEDDEDHKAALRNAKKLKRKRLKRKTATGESVDVIKAEYGMLHDSDSDEMDNIEEEFERAMLEIESPSTRKAPHQLSDPVTTLVARGMPEQPPFQSGCTPAFQGRQFLVWNTIGSIVSHDEQTFHSIEIDYSNKEAGRAARMTDHFHFTMAALDHDGAVLASKGKRSSDADSDSEAPNKRRSKKLTKKSNSGIPSAIFFRPAKGGWANKSEWLVRLPEGEDVTVVALGTQWVAAATTQSFVRLFRRSGLQDPPIMAPGPVVTMAGKGSQLAIVYHRSAPSEDRQNLGFVVYNMEHKSVRTHTHRVVVRGDFPLRPNCTLDWLGFSQNPAAYGSAAGEQEETMLMAVDSEGLVTGLLLNTMGWCGEWTPLLDTARDNTVKSKGSTHWPIGFSRERFLCVVLKGERNFPMTTPKPVPTAIDLHMQCVDSNTSVGKLEEQYLRQSLKLARIYQVSNDSRSKQILTLQAQLDGLILQLLNGACKADKLVRAVDLAMRLHLEKSYDIAVQLAQRAQSTKLAQRIHILKRAKFGELAIDSEEEEDEEEAAKKRRIAEEEQELDFDSLLTAPSDQNQPSKKDRKRRKKAGSEAVPSANGYAVSKKRRRKTDDTQTKLGFATDPDESKKKKGKKSGPKRAMSAYMLFCKDRRVALQEEGVAFKDIGAMLGKQWREIDVQTKKKYTQLAKEDRERYKKDTRDAQRQEARAMMKAPGNARAGSDDEGPKPASIFARKTKKDKPTAKLTNENGNPSNPFSIETKSEREAKLKPTVKANPFAIKSEDASATPKKEKANPFAVKSKENTSTPQNNGRDEQGHATPDTGTRNPVRPLLKRNTSFAKQAREKVSSQFVIEAGEDN